MSLDVIGERIERIFYPRAVRLVGGRNVQVREKRLSESVRRKYPMQIAAMNASV
jgi:hypothetical protein